MDSAAISREFCKVCFSVKKFRLRVKLEDICQAELSWSRIIFWGKFLFLYLITFSGKNLFNQIFSALSSTLTDVDWSLDKKMSKIDTWQNISISSIGKFFSPDSVPFCTMMPEFWDTNYQLCFQLETRILTISAPSSSCSL